MKRVCVFCGSSPGVRADYVRAAQELGALLAGRGIGLVYGGARVGVMGAVADAVLAGGGEAIGVIPKALVRKEVAHQGLSELHVVDTMHQRKALMADLADGFVALPGGFGTFEEFCEVLTWSQLGFHPKPCGLLNVADYYAPLLALFDHGVGEGFIRPQHRALVLAETDATVLLVRMENFVPPGGDKWISREER